MMGISQNKLTCFSFYKNNESYKKKTEGIPTFNENMALIAPLVII